MTNDLPERQDIRPEDQWNLTALYSDDAAWEGDLAVLQGLPAQVEAYRGRLGESAEVLAEALRAWFDANP